MPLFVCAKCGCVENTASGLWWPREALKESFVWPSEDLQFKGKGLCSECAPSQYTDGKSTGYGKWHKRFDKEHYTKVDNQSELLQLPV